MRYEEGQACSQYMPVLHAVLPACTVEAGDSEAAVRGGVAA